MTVSAGSNQRVPCLGETAGFRTSGSLQSRAAMKHAIDYDVEMYEVRKTTFQGFPCVYLDYSLYPDFRINGYVVDVNGRLISISLGCSKDRYARRREQFAQVLQTIKFEKKLNPVSENGSAR